VDTKVENISSKSGDLHVNAVILVVFFPPEIIDYFPLKYTKQVQAFSMYRMSSVANQWMATLHPACFNSTQKWVAQPKRVTGLKIITKWKVNKNRLFSYPYSNHLIG
jgi:hypothetical protein